MKILLIDDDINLSKVISHQLKNQGYEVSTFNDSTLGLKEFKKESFDIVISDIQMPGLSGIDILKEIRQIDSDTVVIMITAYGSVENAIGACRLGADDYITKPFGIEQLLFVMEKALQLRELKNENLNLKENLKEKFKIKNMVAASSPMLDVIKITEKVSKSSSTVLILGESGTGKELIAKAIHFNSDRAKKPFVVVNCPSIPKNLLESDLFGHVKGAFTGALKDRKGKFELADGGSIFLDEIGDLQPELQAKLLRVLQEQEFEKVGSSEPIHVDVRVIAATNQDLSQLIRENKFREDLYYRISVIPITLPPLRERSEDIAYLVDFFLLKFSAGKDHSISQETLKLLKSYSWPGNVRELQNAIEHMVTLARGKKIGPEDIPLLIRSGNVTKDKDTFAISEQVISLEEVERQVITKTLQRTGGNKSKTARLLKIPRHVLLYRLKKLEIR